MQARQIKFLGSPKADTITGQMLALSDTVQRAISKARILGVCGAKYMILGE